MDTFLKYSSHRREAMTIFYKRSMKTDQYNGGEGHE